MSGGEHIKAAALDLAKRDDDAGKAAQQMLDVAAYAADQDIDLWAELTGDAVADEALFRSFSAESACQGEWSPEQVLSLSLLLLQYGLSIAGVHPIAGAAEGAVAALIGLWSVTGAD